MIRFAVLGYGFIGAVHAATLKKIGAELVGVVEQDKSKWQTVTQGNLEIQGGAAPDAPFYQTLDELLAATSMDCLSICLPTYLHREFVTQAMAAGLHVVCEKPMALSLEDCDAMIAAAQKHKRLLFIAQCIRFWPEYEILRKMHQSGELGQLVSLRLHRLSGMPTWGGPSSWFFDEQKSGGCLFDLHVHDLDFIQFLLGRPAAVFSQGTTLQSGANASVFTQYDYGSGVTCCAEGSWRYHSGFRMTFSALYEKGQLEYDSASSPTLKLWRPGESEPRILQVPAGDGYENEYRYFIDCMEKGRPPLLITPQSARQSIEIALVEKKSLHEHRVVRLDDVPR
jgi:predicted dehydrogenase